MRRVLLATSESIPNLTGDDRVLIAALANRGIEARPAIWSAPDINWSSADGVLIRSCWDYHLRLDEFLPWIAGLEKAGVWVWNAPSTLRWNCNKSYLRDLEQKGVAIVPTVWPEENLSLAEILRDLGWKKAVVKPRVSATAYRTQLVDSGGNNAAQQLLDELVRGPGVMVQQFMKSVISRGEWSLVFFNGQFSHAVIKQPKPGDFRVQHDFGGSETPATPSAFVLDAASRAIACVDPTPLYARVDGVEDGGRFLLMELELIEPALFLSSASGSAVRFADAIEANLAT